MWVGLPKTHLVIEVHVVPTRFVTLCSASLPPSGQVTWMVTQEGLRVLRKD